MLPLVFNIRPLSGKRKVQCRIYATKRAMLAAIRKETIGGIENATLACTAWAVRGQRDMRIAAFVFFCKPHLSPGIVAHELYHAAEGMVKTQPGERREEEVAQRLGELVEAFHKTIGL